MMLMTFDFLFVVEGKKGGDGYESTKNGNESDSDSPKAKLDG